MINQEFKSQGTKYQVLPNFGICCYKLQVTSFHASVRNFYSVALFIILEVSEFLENFQIENQLKKWLEK